MQNDSPWFAKCDKSAQLNQILPFCDSTCTKQKYFRVWPNCKSRKKCDIVPISKNAYNRLNEIAPYLGLNCSNVCHTRAERLQYVLRWPFSNWSHRMHAIGKCTHSLATTVLVPLYNILIDALFLVFYAQQILCWNL